MPLPNSLSRDGFLPASMARKRMKLKNGHLLKPILIGTEGETNTGKSEFALSLPGPGACIVLDRNLGFLDNPNPPKERHSDNFGFKVVSVPPNSTADQPTYLEYYKGVRESFKSALENPDVVSVVLDGDSDFWELHRLASFGKLTNVWPQTKYGDVYAQRRALTARAWDSAKIVLGTNKLRDEYVTVYKPDGTPELEKDGNEVKKKTGNKVRQGFPDQDYLWEIQLLHMRKDAHINPFTKKLVPQQWGVRVLKCKHSPSMQGTEIWGADCNFKGLMQVLYPEIPLGEWNL